jgi:hypothetical protein
MLVRYSKKHVRRQQDKTHADWVSVDDSELVVTCNPPGWRVPREFDFAFLVPFATTTLANSVALAFGRFAVRFARDTAVSRYADFRNLWLAIAAQAEATPNASNLRTGALASWWKEAAQAYATAKYERSNKATSAKAALQSAWTVLDELASCGLLIDVPPKEPPKNLHLTKVPRPSLVELAATKPASAEEKSALVRHFRSIGVPVDDAEAERFIELVAGLLTPEERRDPKKATAAYSTRATEYLNALKSAAEARFLEWQQHYSEGQRLLASADPQVLVAFPDGLLPTERASPEFRRFFPKKDTNRARANFLLLMREKFQGRVPSSETLARPCRERHVKLVVRLGGRHYLDAMLSLHREGVAAAALLYIADTGANLSTALSLETKFERATSDANYVEFFAVKKRAGYAAIYDVLPVNEPGRRISTVKALRAVAAMTSDRRKRFPQLGKKLFVFTWFHEPSVAAGTFLSTHLAYLLKSAALPRQWTLSGMRAAVGIVDTLDGTGTLNGLRRKLNHGKSSFATTATYALRWPIRKQLELEMAKYQRLFQAGVASNLQGALQWLHKSPQEAAALLREAERTGLGFLCAAPKSGARPGTHAGTKCGKVGECTGCSVRLFVADEESLAEVVATNLSLKANLARLEAESAERFDELWIELLAFTTVALEEAKRGPFAYLVPRAARKAEQWLAAGFDITDLRP